MSSAKAAQRATTVATASAKTATTPVTSSSMTTTSTSITTSAAKADASSTKVIVVVVMDFMMFVVGGGGWQVDLDVNAGTERRRRLERMELLRTNARMAISLFGEGGGGESNNNATSTIPNGWLTMVGLDINYLELRPRVLRLYFPNPSEVSWYSWSRINIVS